MYTKTSTPPIAVKRRGRTATTTGFAGNQQQNYKRERQTDNQPRDKKRRNNKRTVLHLPKFGATDSFTIGVAVALHLMYPQPKLLRLKTQDNQVFEPVDIVNQSDLIVKRLPPEDYELFCDWWELIHLYSADLFYHGSRCSPIRLKRYTFALANEENSDWIVCHTDDLKVLDGIELACRWMRLDKTDIVMRLYDGDRGLI